METIILGTLTAPTGTQWQVTAHTLTGYVKLIPYNKIPPGYCLNMPKSDFKALVKNGYKFKEEKNDRRKA